MKLSSDVRELKGVGEKVAKKLAKLDIHTIEDLLLHFPRRYEDYSQISPISQLKLGSVTIEATIKQLATRPTRRRNMKITEAILEDESGALKAVWFNQPYLGTQYKKGDQVFASGELEFSYNTVQLMNPAIEKVSDFPKHTARIVPVYPETKGVTSKQLRLYISRSRDLLSSLPELVPNLECISSEILSYRNAVSAIHFPKNTDQLKDAQRALSYYELFVLMSASMSLKRRITKLSAHTINFDQVATKQFVEGLPFKLTDDQRKVAWKVLQDMERDNPMNRILQGDVGTGKTVVAAIAALNATRGDYQVALLAPTEVLAQQHIATFKEMFPDDIKIEFIRSKMKQNEKNTILDKTAQGDVDILIGTHALLQKKVLFKSLGLVIVDEQHRFGVDQRKLLREQTTKTPHLLSMSATPIPRSLALTLYGELDVSSIREYPKGHKIVETKVIKDDERVAAYQAIDRLIEKGDQVFVVCPLISESDKLAVKSVDQEFERLDNQIFKKRKIAMLHGRLKHDEKKKIIDDFKNKKIDILISTTVVEVGVDIPNATVMLIEGAERFGLASLHQLRGRVGRGQKQGYCYVITSPGSAHVPKRLKALERTHDGFELAELDLELRGPGQVYGKMQSGKLDLNFANLSDQTLIEQVKNDVLCFLEKEKLEDYPQLMSAISESASVTMLD